MAFSIAALASWGSALGSDLFKYESTADALATIATDDYFLTAFTQLGAGDFILADGSDGSGMYRVLASTASTVTVEPFPSLEGGGQIVLTGEIVDVSTASSLWLVSPVAGNIVRIMSVIDGTIATAPCVLDPQIGGTSITGGAISIADSGSAAGDVDTATPTALNVVAAGGAIEIANADASTNTVRAQITVVIQPT